MGKGRDHKVNFTRSKAGLKPEFFLFLDWLPKKG